MCKRWDISIGIKWKFGFWSGSASTRCRSTTPLTHHRQTDNTALFSTMPWLYRSPNLRSTKISRQRHFCHCIDNRWPIMFIDKFLFDITKSRWLCPAFCTTQQHSPLRLQQLICNTVVFPSEINIFPRWQQPPTCAAAQHSIQQLVLLWIKHISRWQLHCSMSPTAAQQHCTVSFWTKHISQWQPHWPLPPKAAQQQSNVSFLNSIIF